MSKASLIMSLYDGKRTTKEIARIVGCRPEYVRVVARQRNGRGASEIDRRWLNSELGKAYTEKMRDRRLASNNARYRALRAACDVQAASEAAKKAYRAAILQGKSTKDAACLANKTRQRIMRDTGDSENANRVAREVYKRVASGADANVSRVKSARAQPASASLEVR